MKKVIKKRNKKIIVISVVLVLEALIYLLAYYTGGIYGLSSQLMYLPVVIAGSVLGLKAGMIFALLSALLIGPFMPVEIVFSSSQDLGFWLFRLLTLLVAGTMSGYLYDNYRFQKQSNRYKRYQATKKIFIK